MTPGERTRRLRLRHLRRVLLAVGVLTIVGAAAAVAAVVVAGVGARDAEPEDSPLLVAAPTTTTTTVPTTAARTVRVTTTTVPLPVPEPPPADPYADVPIIQIGTISIPKVGVIDHPIFEGVWLTVIDQGPGHWPGSAMPGERGNTVFPGHRVTHTRPFYDLDLLVPGDEVMFRMRRGTFIYAVTGTQIVLPTDLWVTDQTPESTMTLFACNPKGSASQRIVVKGALVRSEPSLESVAVALLAGESLPAPVP